MRIVIINDWIVAGGAERYAVNLKGLLEEYGHQVFYLYLDKPHSKEMDPSFIFIGKKKYFPTEKLYADRKVFLNCKHILYKLQPDVVFLNNIFLSPMAIWKALRGERVYQIIHDHHPCCPKSTCIRDDKSICSGYLDNDCIRSCTYHGDKLRLLIKLIALKRQEWSRRDVVKCCIAPSRMLTEYLKGVFQPIVTINNFITARPAMLHYKEKKDYLYAGGINAIKGIHLLLDAFKKLPYKDVRLFIAGNMGNEEDRIRFEAAADGWDSIIYLGEIPHEELLYRIRGSYAVVIPSEWLENYPTIALEGMMEGTLVIGSDRGGIPEILMDGRGLLFDPADVDMLSKRLQDSYCMSKAEYMDTIKRAQDHVLKNNDKDSYYNELMRQILL